MTKIITELDLFPRLEEVYKKQYLKKYENDNIEKKYSKRKMWEGQAEYITQRLDEYLDIVNDDENKKVEDLKERLKLISHIDDDEIIIDYISSQSYLNTFTKIKKNQYIEKKSLTNKYIKKLVLKKSFNLIPQVDYSQKVEFLASFIVYPQQRKHGIMTEEQERDDIRRYEDRGVVFYDENGNEIRILNTVRARYKRSKSLERQYNSDDSNSKTYEVRDAFDSIVPDVDLSVVDLSNPDHIKVLLEGYKQWQEIIIEKGNVSDEFLELLSRLDKTIETSKFSSVDLQIINLLKQKQFSKLSYKKIHSIININNPQNNITYKQLTDRCSISIPSKIAKTYKKHYENIK